MKRLACVTAVTIALAGCGAPAEKPAEVPSQDTIACQLAGQRLVIRFLPDEVRLLTPEGERVVLQKVPASSGVRYTNGLVEIRGGGPLTNPEGLIYVREGTGYPLQGCAPLMVPGPAK
jgi:hypothetical protein